MPRRSLLPTALATLTVLPALAVAAPPSTPHHVHAGHTGEEVVGNCTATATSCNAANSSQAGKILHDPWRNAVFAGTNLRMTHFRNAQLDGSSFPLAQLQGAKFTKVSMGGANFDAAVMERSRIESLSSSNGQVSFKLANLKSFSAMDTNFGHLRMAPT